MSFNLIIIKSAPYSGRRSFEILEAIMSLALFDIEHRVVFFEQGVSWLLTDHQTGDQKSLEKQLSALPLYGSEFLYVCQEHRGSLLGSRAIQPDVSDVDLVTLSDWMTQANHVEVF